MLKKKIKILLTLSFLFFFPLEQSLYGNPSPGKIRHHLFVEKEKLSKISDKIFRFEKKLEGSNREVVELGQKSHLLEREIFDLKKEVSQSLGLLLRERSEIKSLIATYIVNMMGEKEGVAELLTKKILVKKFKKELSFYERKIEETQQVQKRLKSLRSSLKDYKGKQKILMDLMAHLEEQKKREAKHYRSAKNSYEKYLTRWQKIKVKKTRTNKTRELRSRLGTFSSPLKRHFKMDFKKKGVTFFFRNKRLPVFAPRKGKVIHSAALPPYGNVIMIDHGRKTISVCFGDFSLRVKKGAKIREGQIIGHTLRKKKTEGKLYFEVRKKEKAQPTIHLLNDEGLAKAGGIRL